jgi:hypothetical protein
MSVHINQLVKSLLSKDSIEQCSLQELQSFVESNPHFGAAQLLLTKKIKAEKPDLYNDQLQKTFLYFHNPLWVEQLMNDTGNATLTEAPKTEEEVISVIEEPATAIVTITVPAEVPVSVPEITEIIKEEIPEPSIAGQTIALAEVKTETALPVREELLFEPFHTVDYFASQGIKFKQEEKPVDKFGQQLKSFTDWLKILKKNPSSEINKNVTAGSEKKVEQLAEYSLQEKEVVTEAMAEVWAKQGNTQKAITLYSKLSLQEPAKSTYFAALIDELKKKL